MAQHVLTTLLTKIDDRATSLDDFEPFLDGDIVLKLMEHVEVGDVFVVVGATETDDVTDKVELRIGDRGTVRQLGENGCMVLQIDRLLVAHLLDTSKTQCLRFVPKAFRTSFLHEHNYGYVKFFDERKYGVDHIEEDISIIDRYIDASKSCFDMSLQTGPELSALEVVRDMYVNFSSCVLAAIMVPGWSVSWALSIVALIISQSSCCAHLMLMALQGGVLCEKQIEFIQTLLPQLGFKKQRHTVLATMKTWRWARSRRGGDTFTVELWQFSQAERVDGIFQLLAPSWNRRKAPNLKRLAVVSAPVTEISDPVNERLNVCLLKGLDKAAKLARHKGFFSQEFDAWMTSERANGVHREYFGLPALSLAKQGMLGRM